MKNPIPKSNMFVTPRSLEDLAQMIGDISGSAEEQRLVWLGASMALNLAHDMVETQHCKEQV